MKIRLLMVVLSLLTIHLEAAREDFDYGVELFEDGDYYRSITELERFRHFHPKLKESEGALWLVADAYFKGEKWDLAKENYDAFVKAYPASPHAVEAIFFGAEADYEARKLALAKQAYVGLLQNPGQGDLAMTARLRLASLSLIDGKWSEATTQFEEAGKLDPGRLDSYSRWESLSREGQQLRPYSATLATLSSAVIPGSGQMECGYWSDGISSLILVGGLAAWSAYFYATHQQLSGTVFASVGGVFYLGNLQGAFLAAKRANRDRPRALIKQILDEVGSQAAPSPDLQPWIKTQP
jgi:tetratricopeptide (TPR) repeat protein